ncbi:OmpA family protein [Planctellipticum variicoloris]|nr:OmpA family protein [Planctomycetaceae bacterium SH412]
MMSLLLTFFIMLVSMAEMKSAGKMKAMLNSMKEQFGPLDGIFGAPGDSLQTTGAMETAASHGNASKGGTKKGGYKSKGLAGPSASVKRLAHGTVITLGGPAVFSVHTDRISESTRKDLEAIGRLLAGRQNNIVVSGHTSREQLPGDSPFKDPFELSFARARKCAQFLMDQGISPTRIQVVAIGDSEPKVISRLPEAQQQNDRVDVFVVDTYTTADSKGNNPDQSPAAPAGAAASPAERP